MKLNQQQKDDIISKLYDGVNIATLSKELCLPYFTVYRLAINRVKLLSPGKPKGRKNLKGITVSLFEEKIKVLMLLQNGETYSSIQRSHFDGITKQRVQQIAAAGLAGVKGIKCGRCSNQATQRHHINYWPEEVEYLCSSCHGKTIAERKHLITKRKLLTQR
jgi:hypothetical protein